MKLQAVILATNQKYNVRFDDFIGFLYEKHCMDGSKSLELLRPFDGWMERLGFTSQEGSAEWTKGSEASEFSSPYYLWQHELHDTTKACDIAYFLNI